MNKNKYEDIQMIDLEDKVDDILDIFINRLYHTDKTVGIVVNKEIAEYILDELVKIDETSIKEVCFVDNININEYLVSVDDNEWIRVIPVDNHSVIDDVDIVYIDMDGDISQDVINYYVNKDKEVILFGQKDDDCDDECTCPECKYSATYKLNDKEVDKDEYEKAIEDIKEKYLDGIRDMLLKYCEIQDEMNEWRKLLNW